MTDPATFDGLLAVVTQEGQTGSFNNNYFPQIYVELFKIRGTTAAAPMGVIPIPLPSGCATAYNALVGFTHDEYLLVHVKGDTGVAFVGGNLNPSKAQLHKYQVSDDGDVQLIWRSDETPGFQSGNSLGNLPTVTRDGSWAAWCIDSLVDMGTGKVQFGGTHTIVPGYVDFAPRYQYWPSPFANCLTRQLLYDGYYPGLSGTDNPYESGSQYGWIYEAVTFSGDVIRSANWHDHPQEYPTAVGYTGREITTSYQDDICYVVYGKSANTSGGNNWRYERIDADTYMPTDEAPPVYTRDLQFRVTQGMQRLPGGGYDLTQDASFYVPTKPNSSGYIDASHNPTWVSIPFTFNLTGVNEQAFHSNGLQVNGAQDQSAGTQNRTLYPRWFDTEGNIGSYLATINTQHVPVTASYAFRPVLPPLIITGAIDETRRLFTAV